MNTFRPPLVARGLHFYTTQLNIGYIGSVNDGFKIKGTVHVKSFSNDLTHVQLKFRSKLTATFLLQISKNSKFRFPFHCQRIFNLHMFVISCNKIINLYNNKDNINNHINNNYYFCPMIQFKEIIIGFLY